MRSLRDRRATSRRDGLEYFGSKLLLKWALAHILSSRFFGSLVLSSALQVVSLHIFWRNEGVKLQTKIMGLCAVGVVLTASVTVSLVFINKGRLGAQVRKEVDLLGQDTCRQVALGVRNMLEVYHRSLLANLDRALNAASDLARNQGGSPFTPRKQSPGRP